MADALERCKARLDEAMAIAQEIFGDAAPSTLEERQKMEKALDGARMKRLEAVAAAARAQIDNDWGPLSRPMLIKALKALEEGRDG